MMDMFNDTDDFLHSNPKDKFFDIVFNANNDVVRNELDKIVQKFVAMESLLEENYGDELDTKIKNFIFEESGEVHNRSTNFYIEKMAEILSQSE